MVAAIFTSENRTNTRIRKSASGCVFLVLILIASIAYWFYDYATTPSAGDASEKITVLIPQGASFHLIQQNLVNKKLIVEDNRFSMLAHLFGYSSRIRAGEFSLSRGLPPLDLLRDLINAKNVQHKVTIPEGLNSRQIADLLGNSGWCTDTSFLSLLNDRALLDTLELEEVDSFEGYLFPDTYYFTRIPVMTARECITMMVNRFHGVWKTLGGDPDKRHETVILASLVEKETGAAEERPRIASVFLNRLKKGMRLQSDPTVIYGIDNFSGNLTKKDLRTATPYNTYVIRGLPKGPIANPGRASLYAVLNPAKEKYLYFVSKNDGTHHFSKSLREHNRAVRQYQKRK